MSFRDSCERMMADPSYADKSLKIPMAQGASLVLPVAMIESVVFEDHKVLEGEWHKGPYKPIHASSGPSPSFEDQLRSQFRYKTGF